MAKPADKLEATHISTEKLIQEALDMDLVDMRDELPYMDQDGEVTDYESLRAWLIPALGMAGV